MENQSKLLSKEYLEIRLKNKPENDLPICFRMDIG